MAVLWSVIGACMVAVVAGQQGPHNTRELPADILRDFPGSCFGSTVCRVFNVSETWPLIPFCGRATCVEKAGKLYEKIEECSTPKFDPNFCHEMIPMIRDPVTGAEHPAIEFPDCCLKVQCEEGHQWTPEYLTREESIKLAEERAKQNPEAAPTAQVAGPATQA